MPAAIARGFPLQRSCLVHWAKRRQAIHDFSSSSEKPHRQAAADHFAKHVRSGSDSKPFLCSAFSKLKPVITSSKISKASLALVISPRNAK
jgi:hypothetical protein